MSEARRQCYAEEVDRALPRLLSMLDREPASETRGSFDREHWGWKLRDFPVTMLQYGLVPLSLLYAQPGGPLSGSERLASWLTGSLEAVLERQRRSGAWDSVAPNAPDHGVTLAMAYVLAEASEALGDALEPRLRERVSEAIRRAGLHGLGSAEDYAFISNHQALVALAYQRAAEHCGEARFSRASEEVVEGILAHQSPDGPFEEYGGPDPGYETLGLFYLALLWQRTGSPTLLDAMGRSVGFLSHCVHPDGSLGGVYGSRRTQLFFPGGLEILAGEVPEAAAISAYLSARLDRGGVVDLRRVDAENLPTLLHAYVVAAREPCVRVAPTELPCEVLEGRVDFDQAGLHAVGTTRYYGVISSAMGGVCRFHEKGSGTLLHQDAGWLVRSGRRRFTSQRTGAGSRLDDSQGLSCQVGFHEVDVPIPTPFRFLLLRAANLTVFRWPRLGALLRRWIIGRLVTAARPVPLTLHRKFRFRQADVEIVDRLVHRARWTVTSAQLVREFTSIHMGSARYFHPSELTVTASESDGTPLETLRASGSASVRTVFRCAAGNGTGGTGGSAEAPRTGVPPAEDLR